MGGLKHRLLPKRIAERAEVIATVARELKGGLGERQRFVRIQLGHEHDIVRRFLERVDAGLHIDLALAEGTVAVRHRSGGDQGSRPFGDFLNAALDEVERKEIK